MCCLPVNQIEERWVPVIDLQDLSLESVGVPEEHSQTLPAGAVLFQMDFSFRGPVVTPKA